MNAPHTTNHPGEAGQVLSISSGVNLAVSVTAVLGAIHHASGPLATRKLPRKPAASDMRNAVAVAVAISELVRESEVAPRGPAGAVEILEDPAEFSRRAGTSLDETEEAISLLFAAEVLARVESTSAARVRFVDGMLAEEPTLAQLAWEEVRTRLRAVGASVVPALAVVRELARTTRMLEPENGSSWAHLSLTRIAERTLFQRTALSTAIAGLESAGVIERGQRRGQEGQYRLLPSAFGAEWPLPSEVGHSSQTIPAPSPAGAPHTATVPAAGPAPSPGMAAGAAIAMQVGGVPFEVPPGVPVRIELDAHGRQYVRIGAHVVIGPL